jgi:hypothetical protein
MNAKSTAKLFVRSGSRPIIEASLISSADTADNSIHKQLSVSGPSRVKGVSFDLEVSLDLERKVHHANTQLYKYQISDLWYSAHEMQGFRRRFRRHIVKYAVQAVAEHRSEQRAVIRRAVLLVQEDTGRNCDIIRATSESISLASRLYARSLAVTLESEIRNRYKGSFATMPRYHSVIPREALAA